MRWVVTYVIKRTSFVATMHEDGCPVLARARVQEAAPSAHGPVRDLRILTAVHYESLVPQRPARQHGCTGNH